MSNEETKPNKPAPKASTMHRLFMKKDMQLGSTLYQGDSWHNVMNDAVAAALIQQGAETSKQYADRTAETSEDYPKPVERDLLDPNVGKAERRAERKAQRAKAEAARQFAVYTAKKKRRDKSRPARTAIPNVERTRTKKE